MVTEVIGKKSVLLIVTLAVFILAPATLLADGT